MRTQYVQNRFLPCALGRETDWRNAANDWLMIRYEVVKVSRLLSRKDLYVRVATLKFIRLCIGSQWRLERS